MKTATTVRVAVVLACGVPFDREEAVERVCTFTEEAAADGARLVLLPEAYVGGYPWGLTVGTTVGARSEEGRALWGRYWANAVDVPGPEIDRMGKAAQAAGVHLCVGVVERDRNYGGGTLFCTLLYLGPDGTLLGKHRKLKPTAAERFIWGEGDGSTLATVQTDYGTVGGLICWENYMPLARMAMYAKGVHIYLAPTADGRERWQSTLQHIALEGRCFVLGCNQFMRRDMYPPELECGTQDGGAPEVLCRGGSAIYGPLGELIAGEFAGEPAFVQDECAVSHAKNLLHFTGGKEDCHSFAG